MRLLHSVKSYLSYLRYPLKSFSDKEPFKDYKIELKNEYFSVYQPKTEKIIAADGNVVCTQLVYRKDILFLYPDINKPNRKFKVLFNSKFFPDLISCSRIQFVLLLPYIPKTDNRTPKWRLVVITDKCQVYHNFPENVSGRNGMITFKESFIWDLPGNKYPSKNVNCEEYEYYNPYLPESAYEYHPAGNSPRSFIAKNRSGREETLSRFYFPKRSAAANPFVYLDGYEPDTLISFIGTYAGNSSSGDGSRIVVFATHDGGKNWFARYEFNDDGRAENYGNNLCKISEQQIDCSTWNICKRELMPSKKDAIMVKCRQPIKVKKLVWNETAEIICNSEHGLLSGNIIAIKGIANTDEENALLNNEFNDNDFGNGVFYKVKVIDKVTFQLFECISKSKTNLPARHIHSINRVKNGFLIATGETYPQGWLVLASITDSDNWSNNYAWDDEIPFIRLNSAKDSVQRIVGAIILDNKDRDLIYASDCSSMNTDHIEVIDGIPTNSMGIYKGKLEDIDDFRNYELWEEVKEPSFFFKDLDGCYVYCGQRGELALGFERGKTWRHGKLSSPLIHYMGRTTNYFVIDGKILMIK